MTDCWNSTEDASEPRRRDAVRALDGTPAIVSVSDVHGYRAAGERALLAVGDRPDFDPVVERGDDGALHWAGNDYVLVFNGDLIDRGPDSAGCLSLAFDLQDEAPPGRVRYQIGNHESYLLFRALAAPDHWYCGTAPERVRRELLARAVAGDVTVAYDGYEYAYSHAGSPDGVDPARLNDRLAAAAAELLALGADATAGAQRSVLHGYPAVFGTGDDHRKGPGAGPVWLAFDHLPGDAPPQVVGHTRRDEPARTGNVVCEDVLQRNRDRDGGEAALVETPDSLAAVVRDGRGGVDVQELDGA